MKRKIYLAGAAVIIAALVFTGIRVYMSRTQGASNVQTFTLVKSDLIDSVLVSGTVKSSNTRNIYSKVANYPVKEVYYKAGDRVKAGAVLAKLDTASLEYDIQQTELNIKNAETAFSNEIAAGKFNIQSAENNVEAAEMELDNAQKNYDQIKKIYEASGAAEDELNRAELMLKKARLAYDNAQASLENIRNKTAAVSGNNIEIQIITLEKQKKILKDAQITTPINGTVTLVNAKENASPAGIIFVVEDTDNLIVSTAIGEHDISLVKPGQEVAIRTDGTGDRQFAGTVSHIAPVATRDAVGNTVVSSNVTYDAEVLLKENDPDIRIGMNVRLTIKLREKKEVYSVPYDAVVNDSDGKKYIYILNGQKDNSKGRALYRKIEVQTGMETDMYVEISSNEIGDGMRVIVNPSETLKA